MTYVPQLDSLDSTHSNQFASTGYDWHYIRVNGHCFKGDSLESFVNAIRALYADHNIPNLFEVYTQEIQNPHRLHCKPTHHSISGFNDFNEALALMESIAFESTNLLLTHAAELDPNIATTHGFSQLKILDLLFLHEVRHASQNLSKTFVKPLVEQCGHLDLFHTIKTYSHYIQACLKNNYQHPMNIIPIPNKGLGVIAQTPIPKYTYVGCYSGVLIDVPQILAKEKQRGFKSAYCFNVYGNPQCKIDAETAGNLSRFYNSSTTPNVRTLVHIIDGIPSGIMVANQDIAAGEELVWDYDKYLTYLNMTEKSISEDHVI